jgi:hypothetical protein
MAVTIFEKVLNSINLAIVHNSFGVNRYTVTYEVTTGYAQGSGDMFTLKDDGSDEFAKLRASLNNARILIRPVNKQPTSGHTFLVNSAKVQATGP